MRTPALHACAQAGMKVQRASSTRGGGQGGGALLPHGAPTTCAGRAKPVECGHAELAVGGVTSGGGRLTWQGLRAFRVLVRHPPHRPDGFALERFTGGRRGRVSRKSVRLAESELVRAGASGGVCDVCAVCMKKAISDPTGDGVRPDATGWWFGDLHGNTSGLEHSGELGAFAGLACSPFVTATNTAHRLAPAARRATEALPSAAPLYDALIALTRRVSDPRR
ncbi:hypothetical protein GCM10027080_08210 [Pedococcus soli]